MSQTILQHWRTQRTNIVRDVCSTWRQRPQFCIHARAMGSSADTIVSHVIFVAARVAQPRILVQALTYIPLAEVVTEPCNHIGNHTHRHVHTERLAYYVFRAWGIGPDCAIVQNVSLIRRGCFLSGAPPQAK
jgi:hypothetical protein